MAVLSVLTVGDVRAGSVGYPMTMQPYSTDALEELLAGGERDWVEFKQDWKEDVRKRAAEGVCAFANDLANHNRPGVLFVGVRDDGTPRGLPIGGQLLEQLTGIKTDGRILPPPTLLVEKRKLAGVDVAVVTVWPADSPPVRYDGRICIRCGPRRDVATAQDERILNEKRRFRDQPFDAQPSNSATVVNLDLSWYRENYLPAAVAAEVLADNGRTLEEQLAGTRMIISPDEPTPTHLGVLTLANQPTDFLPCAYVQFLKLDGQTLADDVLDETRFEGRMVDVIRAIAIARRECERNGNPPPEFDAQDRVTCVTLRPATIREI